MRITSNAQKCVGPPWKKISPCNPVCELSLFSTYIQLFLAMVNHVGRETMIEVSQTSAPVLTNGSKLWSNTVYERMRRNSSLLFSLCVCLFIFYSTTFIFLSCLSRPWVPCCYCMTSSWWWWWLFSEEECRTSGWWRHKPLLLLVTCWKRLRFLFICFIFYFISGDDVIN